MRPTPSLRRPAVTAAGAWVIEWEREGRLQRVQLAGVLRVGRSREVDIVLDDPYASREHCTVSLSDGAPFVDGRGSLNGVLVAGATVESAVLGDGDAFTVGQTVLRVRRAGHVADDATLRLEIARPAFTLRRTSRELVDRGGVLVASLSELECAALAALALTYPEVASHEALGEQIWRGDGFDRYQIHRLLTRLRQRLGEHAELLENVRGAGYRLAGPILVT